MHGVRYIHVFARQCRRRSQNLWVSELSFVHLWAASNRPLRATCTKTAAHKWPFGRCCFWPTVARSGRLDADLDERSLIPFATCITCTCACIALVAIRYLAFSCIYERGLGCALFLQGFKICSKNGTKGLIIIAQLAVCLLQYDFYCKDVF